jgi:hypothetical protein
MQSTRELNAQARLVSGKVLSIGRVDNNGNLLASAPSSHGDVTHDGFYAQGPVFIDHRIKLLTARGSPSAAGTGSPGALAPAIPISIAWSSSSRSTVRMTQRGRQQVSSCPGRSGAQHSR